MRIYKFLFCLFLLTVFSIQDTFAQMGSAEISSEMVIQVDKNQTLNNRYEFSINHLTFPSESEAQQLFNTASEHRVVDFILDYSNQKVEMRIELDLIDAQRRTVDDINQYLSYYSKRINNLYHNM